MTLLFRSKSCKLGPPDPDPPAWEQLEPQENSESSSSSSDEEEADTDDDDRLEPYNHVSGPFTGPRFGDGVGERERDGGGKGGGGGGGGQFPILAFVATALRKSLLVTCSVEREEISAAMDIGRPSDVRHISHVTFDRFHGFLDLPVELLPEVPRKPPSASVSVFGVSPESMQCSIDERGKSVPTLLLMMQSRLYSQGGLQAEGIFRINPDNSQEAWVRSKLNRGIVPQEIDVHCLAGLIKAWFRELPKGVLDVLAPEQVMHCNTEDQCTQLVKQLPPTEAALLDWAVHLMADVVEHQHLNKMNARNIAMVFAPNMTQMADPLTALIHAVQVMNLLKTLILRTLRLREEPTSEGTLGISSSCSDTTPLRTSTSIGDLILAERQRGSSPLDHPHARTNRLLRSVTLDRLEYTRGKKHPKCTQEEDDYDPQKPGHCSRSMSYGRGEAEGLLDRLNFTKGVKKLCRHPVFQQLSRPAAPKKSSEVEGCK